MELAKLIETVDAGLLVVHDGGLDRVESVVLLEPRAQHRIPSHAVVLAVGYPKDDPTFEQLVAQAAAANAVAVVAKPSSASPETLRRLGEQHAITTVLAEPSADWLTLASWLRSAAAVGAVDAVAGIRVGDLFAFANAVASAAAGATAIVDPAGRLLGFSNQPDQPLDDLRRRTTLLMGEPDSPAGDPDYQRLYASDSWIKIIGDGHGSFDRLAIAIRSDGEILGSIWVLLPPGRSQDNAERALLELAPVAAVHLHHARADLDVQRTRQSQLLQALLRDKKPGGSAAALGLHHRGWFRLAILVPATVATPSLSRRHARGISNWLTIIHTQAIFAEIDSLFVVLFSGQQSAQWLFTERSLDFFVRDSDALRGTVCVVTSPAVTRAADLAREFDRLRTLVRVRDGLPGAGATSSPVFRMEDHWADVELAMIASAYTATESPRLSVLASIHDHDREHRSEYWQTLRAYVLSERNFNDAATQLNVHANTVRYRIERLSKTFELDLRDPATFYWIAIQIHYRSDWARDSP